jgi:hypothetical protein
MTRALAFVFLLMWALPSHAAGTLVGPILTYSCPPGQFASSLASGTVATTCLSNSDNTSLANFIALGLAQQQTVFGKLPNLSSSGAGQIENARGLSTLFALQNRFATKISTQTVAAGASMTFTGLTAYLTYFLACSQVFPALTAEIQVQFGEGSPVTWNTSGNYAWSNMALGSNSTTAANAVSTTDNGISPAGGAISPSLVNSIDFWGYLNDVTLSGAVHFFTWTGATKGTNYYVSNGAGTWTSDTNPVTGVRVIAAGQNVTGKCSLYGLNQ